MTQLQYCCKLLEICLCCSKKKKNVIFGCRYDCWDTVEYIQRLKHRNSLYRHSVWLCLVHIADIVCPTQFIMGQWKFWEN